MGSTFMGVVSRVGFAPTLFYDLIMERIDDRRWISRIDETVILGALPFSSTVQELKKENVVAVVSMNKNFELQFCYNKEDWKNLSIEFLRLPVVDYFSTPSLKQIQEGVEFIKKHRVRGTVYVHCKAGRSRSATVVVCYLINVNKWACEEAICHVKKIRPQILLEESHIAIIKEYHSTLQDVQDTNNCNKFVNDKQ